MYLILPAANYAPNTVAGFALYKVIALGQTTVCISCSVRYPSSFKPSHDDLQSTLEQISEDLCQKVVVLNGGLHAVRKHTFMYAMKFAIAFATTIFISAASIGRTNAESLRTLNKKPNGSDDGKRSLKNRNTCEDPARAVMELLECVANEDAVCAAAAYNRRFKRFHNEVSAGRSASAVAFAFFWRGAFRFLDFDFDIKFASNIDDNVASVRYIEKVTSTDGSNLGLAPSTAFPFSQHVDQHEHAVVEVDGDCKILKWDQYGDDKEQSDVENISAALFCEVLPVACPRGRV